MNEGNDHDEGHGYFRDPKQLSILGVLIAVSIGATGFLISESTGEPHWAARFGSVMVIFGLAWLVTLRWRFGYLRNDDEVFEEAVDRAVKAQIGSELDRRSMSFTAELNKSGEIFRNKWFFLAEVLIIALGTFQWGFGDLIACALVIEECRQCA